jgi:hypothetical protein
LTALLVQVQQQELAQEQEPQQVQESVPLQALAQVLVPQPVQEQELVPQPALASVPQLALASVLVLVQHLHHLQLQPRCQLQQSHLQQHEFLSTHQQSAKALQYQLCL